MFHQPQYVAPGAIPNDAPALPPAPRPLDLSVVPPDDREAAMEYDAFLSELTFNSKDVITSLTRVAGENLGAAAGIAATIEQRAFTAPPLSKLPFLYLIDSIVKNIGAAYIACFARNLFHTFTAAYAVAPPQVRMSMHRLLNTWPPIFGMDIVTAMRRRAADYDSAPSHPAPVASQPNKYNFRSAPPRSAPVALQSQQPQSIPLRNQILTNPAPILNSMPPPPQHLNAPPSEHMLQIQNLMADISRKASMAIRPSNRQLLTINTLITTQLQSSPPPPIRDQLLRFQQQLREISSAAPTAQPPFPSSAPIPPTVPTHPAAVTPIPPVSSAALSGLIRALPPGLVAPVQSASTMPPPSIPRRPPAAAPVFQPSMPTTLKFSDLKTMSHAAAVRALYTELPHLSKSDGMRFETKEGLRDHLDWLFKQNRRKRARSQNLTTGGMSRCWYDPIRVFVNKDTADAGTSTGVSSTNLQVGSNLNDRNATNPSTDGMNAADKINDENEKVLDDAVEARGENEICPVCQEGFESFWDDDRRSWMLKEATRTEDGEVYHTRCVVLTDATPTKEEGGVAAIGKVEWTEEEHNQSGRKHGRDEDASEDAHEREAEASEPKVKKPKIEAEATYQDIKSGPSGYTEPQTVNVLNETVKHVLPHGDKYSSNEAKLEAQVPSNEAAGAASLVKNN